MMMPLLGDRIVAKSRFDSAAARVAQASSTVTRGNPLMSARRRGAIRSLSARQANLVVTPAAFP